MKAEKLTLNSRSAEGNMAIIDTWANRLVDVINYNSTLKFDSVYPVGSIYISVNDVNPSELFGGEWERWGNGRVPVGVSDGDEEFSTAEKTGGEKTHTLTSNEMPSHTHSLSAWHGGVGNGTALQRGWSSSTAAASVSPGSTGGDQAHNNLQPYITCYMWKRTA